MPRRPSRRSRLDDDDSESSLSSLSCNSAGVENSDASFYSDLDSSDDSSSAEEVIIGDYSAGGASSGEEDGSVAWKEEESSSGEEEEGSGSSFSGEESSDLFSEKDSDVGSVHYLYPHSASYRENDSSSRSSDGSVSSLDGDDDEEKGSSDENSINEAAVGSAKRFYLDEKFRGSVLKEKKREHIPLLRAMASGLDDGDRQDDRFNDCVENGFVKKKDVEIFKRHLYAVTWKIILSLRLIGLMLLISNLEFLKLSLSFISTCAVTNKQCVDSAYPYLFDLVLRNERRVYFLT